MPFIILEIPADEAILRQRIVDRARAGADASEADLAVPENQLQAYEPLNSDEQAASVSIDGGQPVDVGALVTRLLAKMADRKRHHCVSLSAKGGLPGRPGPHPRITFPPRFSHSHLTSSPAPGNLRPRLLTPERRERMLLLNAFAPFRMTLPGAAGENLVWDRLLKANTVKYRTH